MWSRLGYVVVLTSLLAACGGGGESGMKTNSDTGKDKDKGDSSSANTLPCAAETCKLPSALKGETLCCKDKFVAGGCGVKVGAECRAIPEVDERCPPPEIMVNVPGASGMKVFGCCTGAGECGIDFGMGCQPRTLACMVVRPDQVDMVKHQKCTGEPLPLPSTCGMGGFRFPGAAGGGS